jgi:tetratricopeptide (TPR) repeat protein
MRSLRFAVAVLALFVSAAPARAKELWEYDWIEVRTPHFAIASAQSEERTRELAVDLENFRMLAEKLTNIGRFEERIPTKIYLLPKSEKDLGFTGLIAGYFSGGMRANYAVIAPTGSYSDEVLKHEYVHFLIHNRDRALYPTWFDEGFADLLATLRVKGARFEYGQPVPTRIDWLLHVPWLPAKKLLETRDTSKLGRDRGAMFYAQSWLLVHYLMIGNEGFGAKNADFLARRERGEAVLPAFEAAFGIKPSSLTLKLQRYLPRLVYYTGTLKQAPAPVEVSVRPLARAQIAAALGTLALLSRGAEAASTYYGAALAADPEHGPALAGVADVHKFAGRFAEAKPYYEQAIALEPHDENHELDYAEYFLDLARKYAAEGGDAETLRAHLAEARKHFMRGYQINPDNPEILAMNGATYLFEGEDAIRGVESLEAAHALLPAQKQIRQLLAQAYIAAGESAKARAQLETLLAWTHAGGVEEIRALLDSLDVAQTQAAGEQAATAASE